VSALEAVQADAQAAPEGVAVALVTEAGDFEVHVPLPGRWKTRANRALKDGDFDLWAELVLSAEDYATWLEADPVNDDVEQFFEAWGTASGENSGKSQPSRRSSRSTARK
jgi:hypothetical protein